MLNPVLIQINFVAAYNFVMLQLTIFNDPEFPMIYASCTKLSVVFWIKTCFSNQLFRKFGSYFTFGYRSMPVYHKNSWVNSIIHDYNDKFRVFFMRKIHFINRKFAWSDGETVIFFYIIGVAQSILWSVVR